MKRLEPNAPELQSADVVADNIAHLKTLFPEAFAAEGKIDFDVLKQLLGGEVDDREERYGLNWHGKRKARQLALTPSTGTLRPCPEESIDWDTTQNIFIEGDNLEVLKLLQKSYAGKVKLIYIDPPYNTGHDFVYPDNFQDSIKNYLEITGQVEGGQKVSSNTEASGRFHTDWLNMMYPRLRLARQMLSENGAIFVSLGDQEIANLRLMMDDVFGESNFIATIVWQKKQSPQNDAVNISDMHDYVVVYAKMSKASRQDPAGWGRNKLPRTEEQETRYGNRDNDPRGDWTSSDLTCAKTFTERPNLFYPITNPVSGRTINPSPNRVWAYEKPVMLKLIDDKRIWWGSDASSTPRLKVFRAEVDDGVVPSTWWAREFAGDNQQARRELRELFPEGDVFDTPKPLSLLGRICEIATTSTSQDVVLDFFAGSGTLGHAVMESNRRDNGNRRFITVQLPEPIEGAAYPTISAVAVERLRRAGKSLRQSTEVPNLDLGFRVFKLDSGNIEPWDPATKDVPSAIAKAVDNVKADRTDDDLIYDVLLKTGLDLCVPIESKKIAGKEVKSIGGGVLFTCFATKIKAADAEPLALGIVKWRDELAPANPKECRVVFRDSAFESDVAKSNLAAILKQHGFDEKLIASL